MEFIAAVLSHPAASTASNLVIGVSNLVIGAIGLWIAGLVYQIQRTKVRLDLYDKRFEVYKSLTDFLRDVVSDGTLPVERLHRYRTDVSESVFLFDNSISDYLETVSKKAVDLRGVGHGLDNPSLPVGAERSRLAEEDKVLLQWLDAQLTESHALFMKYLGFTKL